jgi:hypothetical protein
MPLPYPDPRAETIVELWRLKLAEAESRYTNNRNRENRTELIRVLGLFTGLVMRGLIPREPGIATWSER